MLLKTKLTNMLIKEAVDKNIEIDVLLHNITVNGEKRGCSGHIINKTTGKCVYINTEGSSYGNLNGQVMYRLAVDFNDYSSTSIKYGHNRWCDEDQLSLFVISLLKNKNEKQFEIGKLVATRGVHTLSTNNPEFTKFVMASFDRYIDGDWGDLCEEYSDQNDDAIKNGERILAVYEHPNQKDWRIWIITAGDRSVTTILFPNEDRKGLPEQ